MDGSTFGRRDHLRRQAVRSRPRMVVRSIGCELEAAHARSESGDPRPPTPHGRLLAVTLSFRGLHASPELPKLSAWDIHKPISQKVLAFWIAQASAGCINAAFRPIVRLDDDDPQPALVLRRVEAQPIVVESDWFEVMKDTLLVSGRKRLPVFGLDLDAKDNMFFRPTIAAQARPVIRKRHNCGYFYAFRMTSESTKGAGS